MVREVDGERAGHRCASRDHDRVPSRERTSQMTSDKAARAEDDPSLAASAAHVRSYTRGFVFGAIGAALPTRPALLAVLLFGSGAAFTLWRNTQVGVLVDIAYVLNTATRIAAGDVPYAGFPLAQAPLEFLVQAALIKAFGPHFVVQIAYATVLGGLGTTMTYAIIRRILAGAVPASDLVAAILAVPLVPLGVYSIYPHPIYDPDACLLVLAATLLILVARDGSSVRRWLLAGAVAAVPVFVKQNIGGTFLILVAVACAVDALVDPRRRAGFRWWAAGVAGALMLELVALQLVVGLGNYLRWAWTFALAARGVNAARITSFVDPRIVWPALLILVPAFASPRLPTRARGAAFVGALCVPAAIGIARPSVWLAVPEVIPPLLIAVSLLAIATAVHRRPTFETLLPIVMGGTIAGALESQGLYASSFGIFPLLIVALASLVAELTRRAPRPVLLAPLAGIVLAVILTVSGAAYALSNSGLLFIDANAGPVQHSSFPSLAGLSARGPYLADLDEILFWTRDNVPQDEPMVFLPGEDPVFFALGRRPRLPAVYFYDVASPLPPAEIARAADSIGLRWVFVKERLQLKDVPPTERELVARLTERARLVARVGAYLVYRR